jgi:hypothetical protein
MSRKTVIAIVGRIVIATVIAALMGGAWWLWRRLLTGPAVNWSDRYVAAILVGSLGSSLITLCIGFAPAATGQQEPRHSGPATPSVASAVPSKAAPRIPTPSYNRMCQ